MKAIANHLKMPMPEHWVLYDLATKGLWRPKWTLLYLILLFLNSKWQLSDQEKQLYLGLFWKGWLKSINVFFFVVNQDFY